VAPVPVVCAVIVRSRPSGTKPGPDVHQVLVAQQPAGGPFGLKWEFPGGKVEPGESLEGALAREIREELGCALGPVHELVRNVHPYSEGAIELIAFLCRIDPSGVAPEPREHADLRWLEIEELGSIDLAPADVPITRALAEAARHGALDRHEFF